MHDSEPDTFSPKNKRKEYCEVLEKIGINAEPKQFETDEVEKSDYYSKYFSNSPAMVTNHGCIELKGRNIDVIQIIQKG
ncbi:MAG TPA: hypothetical protein VJR22_07100 [Candidatus Nitrosotalea sp.]|nr:hypothetical protein [Nitrososphaerota archaeon]HKU33596.1 hypothetical protein [Candidatus Nitrosotalea sp.]